jgi:hypothetical protein
MEEAEVLELRMANYDPSVGAAVLHAYLSGETQIRVFGNEPALDEFASKYRQILEGAGMIFTKRKGYCLIEKTVSSPPKNPKSLCDLCLADLSQGKAEELSSGQMQDIAKNGFGPCAARTILAKSGKPFAALAALKEQPEGLLDGIWRRLVLMDNTPWLLCGKCARNVTNWQAGTSKGEVDKSVAIERLPETWKPGCGKSGNVADLIPYKRLPTAATAICDICGFETPRGTIRKGSAAFVKEVIKQGLNPWTDKRINSARLNKIMAAGGGGVSVRQAYQDWLVRSLADNTDWGLCDQCFAVVSDSSVRFANPSARRWWQFWK